MHMPLYTDIDAIDGVGVCKDAWENRDGTALFRGGATGIGVTPDTNQRMKIAEIAEMSMGEAKASSVIDAGITGFNERYKFGRDGNVYFINKEELGHLQKDKIDMVNQCYKYVIYASGQSGADRMSKQLVSGSVMIYVKSDAPQPWIFSQLEEEVHYVSVEEDLSNLVDVVRDLKENDQRAKEMQARARKFTRTTLKEFKDIWWKRNPQWEHTTICQRERGVKRTRDGVPAAEAKSAAPESDASVALARAKAYSESQIHYFTSVIGFDSRDIWNVFYQNDYLITEKTDGERILVSIKDGYIVGRKRNGEYFLIERMENEHRLECVIDCERVVDEGDQIVYYAFDVVNRRNGFHEFRRDGRNEGQDIGRRAKIRNILRTLHQKPLKTNFKLKKMYPASAISYVVSNVLPNLPHESDGLIFTPVHTKYNCWHISMNEKKKPLKWKPSHLQTIDFYVGSKNEQNMHRLYVNGNDGRFEQVATLRVTDNCKEGDFVECKLIADAWEFYKPRNDKQEANSYGTYTAIMKQIRHPVALTDLVHVLETIHKPAIHVERELRLGEVFKGQRDHPKKNFFRLLGRLNLEDRVESKVYNVKDIRGELRIEHVQNDMNQVFCDIKENTKNYDERYWRRSTATEYRFKRLPRDIIYREKDGEIIPNGSYRFTKQRWSLPIPDVGRLDLTKRIFPRRNNKLPQYEVELELDDGVRFDDPRVIEVAHRVLYLLETHYETLTSEWFRLKGRNHLSNVERLLRDTHVRGLDLFQFDSLREWRREDDARRRREEAARRRQEDDARQAREEAARRAQEEAARQVRKARYAQEEAARRAQEAADLKRALETGEVKFDYLPPDDDYYFNYDDDDDDSDAAAGESKSASPSLSLMQLRF